MQLKQLFADEDAVSPVIGVILMVAITVILAAVIGTFVLGLGDNVQSNAPNANFQFEYPNGSYAANDNGEVISITHNGGQSIDRANVNVQAGGITIDDLSTSNKTVSDSDGWESTISTGDTVYLGEDSASSTAAKYEATTTPIDFESGQAVRVIWQSPSGGSSNTIGSSTVP